MRANPRRWWRTKAFLAFAGVALVLSVAATPAAADSTAWHKNTYFVTGPQPVVVGVTKVVLHIDYLLPPATHGSRMYFEVIGPNEMGSCTFHDGVKAVSGRVQFYRGDAWYVSFRRPPLPTATRSVVVCDGVRGGVDRLLSGKTEFRRS